MASTGIFISVMAIERIRLKTENSLMVLILDDDLERLGQFKEHWGGHILGCVTTAREAIALLEHFVFDLVFLDHDLGGKVFVSSSNTNTGAEVARWLEDPMNHLSKPRSLIIHTLNPAGRKYMAQALPYAMVCTDGAWNYSPEELPHHLLPATRFAR
jgi:hypothetical protein